MFNRIEGDTVVLSQGGLYKMSDLYEWDGGLFAKVGSGYARLRENGTTSKDGVRIEHMETERDLFKDRFGRLATKQGDGYLPVTLQDNGKLLLASN